jgi:hypothetical protein
MEFRDTVHNNEIIINDFCLKGLCCRGDGGRLEEGGQ